MWENITTVIANIITLVGTMTNGLLQNDLFLLILGLIFFSIAIGIIFRLVKEIKKSIYYYFD